MGRNNIKNNLKLGNEELTLNVGSLYELKTKTLFCDPINGWKMFPPNSIILLLNYNESLDISNKQILDKKRKIIKITVLNPEGIVATRVDFSDNLKLFFETVS